MALPALVAVDEHPDVLASVETQLSQRYGRDYSVECLADPDEAVRRLTELRDAGEHVALVFAGQSLPGAWRGAARPVRRLHPHAKRALLVPANAWADEPTARAIRASMALGRIDYYIRAPAASPPDEVFHEAVSEFLLEWARERLLVPQTVHIVGESWSGRAYELREVFARCAVPHAFCLADSDKGRELLAKAGPRAEAAAHGACRTAEPSATLRTPRSRKRQVRPLACGEDVRPRDRRRRARGAVRGRLRRLRGPARPRGRCQRHRRAGEVELADPQLPRLRQGRQRQPARRGGVRAGVVVRRQLPVHAPRGWSEPIGRLPSK